MECYLHTCNSDPNFTQSLLYETCAFCFTSAITVVKANIHRALQSQSPAGFTCFFAIARIFKENVCVACVRASSDRCALCGTTYRCSRVRASVRRANCCPLITVSTRRGLRPPLCPTELSLQKSSRVRLYRTLLAGFTHCYNVVILKV